MHSLHWCVDGSALLTGKARPYIPTIESTAAPGWRPLFQARRKGMNMNVAHSFNNWRKYRRTVSELGRMSNRKLNDLGIERSDIQRIAREAVAR
jgi:uncharacterized protein YjiS (DUF1127 family)